ncbi:MAG: PAS domain-containing protein, partial [Cyanobacteria bacterium P01_A01_bin.83]
YSVAEFYDNPSFWLEVVHPDDRDRVSEFPHKTIEQGSCEMEYRIVRPDGEIRWLLDRANLTCDDDNKPLRVDGNSTDITQRKLAETLLKESQERFDLAVRGSRDGLWDWNIITDEVFYAPRFKAMIGYTEGEMPNLFEAWSSKLHPEDSEPVLAAVQNHLERRVPYNVEYRLQTKQGDYCWFNARGQAIWNKAGQAIRMAGSITDISDRKQAEVALRESEQRFRNMADNAPMMVWVTDENACCTFVSQSWCEFTGQTKETGLGFGWLDAVHPDDFNRARTIFSQANERAA